MDSNLAVTLFLALGALAAGAAPLNWPQHKWIANGVFWLSAVGCLLSLAYMVYANGGVSMLQKPIYVIALGLVIAGAGVIWQLRSGPVINQIVKPQTGASPTGMTIDGLDFIVPTVPPAQVNQPITPKPFLSNFEKEKIAEALFELSELNEKRILQIGRDAGAILAL